MSDIQQQLADLRQRIARIHPRGAMPMPAPLPPVAVWELPPHPEEWMPGDEVETPHGRHFETERLYEKQRMHGSADIGALAELPPDLLGPMSRGEVPGAPCERWAFLDTETTGLAGGSGTYAFLIGVGRITSEGFRVRQFFMREFAEEPSLLHALAEHLSNFDVMITYNGKAYDQPLLETRYRMCRAKPPFTTLAHLDLLFGARRLWKLRFDGCRLTQLERQVFGVERHGDLPGEMIPYVYFEYLRSREIGRLLPVFHHNATDILTLACMTAIVPWAFNSPDSARLQHGAELAGLARWHAAHATLRTSDGAEQDKRTEQYEIALALYRRALDRNLRDELLFQTLWDIASLEKKLGRHEAALQAFADLTASRNPFRAAAYQELAKHYEHRERNYAMALEMTRCAIDLQPSEALHRRADRLRRRMSVPKTARLI